MNWEKTMRRAEEEMDDGNMSAGEMQTFKRR